MDYRYVSDYQRLGFGLFVHYGLYSNLSKGEWAEYAFYQNRQAEYEKEISAFHPAEDWADQLCLTALSAHCRYIILTTRHHEGFSLYDTCGLSDFDAPHSACHRDLIREYVDACRRHGLLPVFYHTVIDWHSPLSKGQKWDEYFDYLRKSIAILCQNYGPIGGIWFDGTWGLPQGVTFPSDIYTMIHHYQPHAVVINNTGLSALGARGASQEIDGVTFERGKAFPIQPGSRPIVGEVCDAITDHWGYAENDLSQKTPRELVNILLDARGAGCNLVLNVGPKADGTVPTLEKEILKKIGLFLATNHDVVLRYPLSSLKAENAEIYHDEASDTYYAVIRNVGMVLDQNVTFGSENRNVVLADGKVLDGYWLDNNEPIDVIEEGKAFRVRPFRYGVSLGARIAAFHLGDKK